MCQFHRRKREQKIQTIVDDGGRDARRSCGSQRKLGLFCNSIANELTYSAYPQKVLSIWIRLRYSLIVRGRDVEDCRKRLVG